MGAVHYGDGQRCRWSLRRHIPSAMMDGGISHNRPLTVTVRMCCFNGPSAKYDRGTDGRGGGGLNGIIHEGSQTRVI